jgi:hypothetical protein
VVVSLPLLPDPNTGTIDPRKRVSSGMGKLSRRDRFRVLNAIVFGSLTNQVSDRARDSRVAGGCGCGASRRLPSGQFRSLNLLPHPAGASRAARHSSASHERPKRLGDRVIAKRESADDQGYRTVR